MKNALIVVLRHHGDVLLSTPVIQTLKRLEPDTNIELLLYSYATDLVRHHPDVAAIHTVDRRWKEMGVATLVCEELKLLRGLRNKNYSMMITLTDQWRVAWLSRLLKPDTSVALTAVKRECDSWRNSFTHYYPLVSQRYMVDLHLDALRTLSYEVKQGDRQVRLHVPDTARKTLLSRLHSLKLPSKEIVLLHPTSRGMHKCWSAERYSRLINRLHQQGQKVLITAAAQANEMSLVHSILQACDTPPYDLSGQLTLLELGALIELASVLICVDSVPMHMAAALGTPSVALFGPTDEQHWGPQLERIKILASDRACRPCYREGCNDSGKSDCLDDIEVDEVLQACLGFNSI